MLVALTTLASCLQCSSRKHLKVHWSWRAVAGMPPICLPAFQLWELKRECSWFPVESVSRLHAHMGLYSPRALDVRTMAWAFPVPGLMQAG